LEIADRRKEIILRLLSLFLDSSSFSIKAVPMWPSVTIEPRWRLKFYHNNTHTHTIWTPQEHLRICCITCL